MELNGTIILISILRVNSELNGTIILISILRVNSAYENEVYSFLKIK